VAIIGKFSAFRLNPHPGHRMSGADFAAGDAIAGSFTGGIKKRGGDARLR
jgi:hypothetical protein